MALLLTICGIGILASVLIGVFAPRLWLACVLAGTAGSLGAAAISLGTGQVWELQSALTVGGEPVHLRLDGLSALFLVLLSLVGGAGAVYAREYWSGHGASASARSGRVWWSGLLLSLGLVLLASMGCIFSSRGSCSRSAPIF